MKKTRIVLLMTGLFALAAPSATTQDKVNPHTWKSRVTSVTVFKNGLGFFMRQGEVGLREGWCVAESVPPAAFGTLAIFSHDEAESVDIVGSGPGEIVEFDGRDAPKDAASKRTRLEGCRFLAVQLTYAREGRDVSAAGKLMSIGPEYVVLETDGGSSAVPVERITKLQVLENPLRVHVASDKGPSPTKTTLGMAYLRKGVTWIPEYTLRLLDEENAELTLRGTVVNEAEDLVHCDVNFVVGVPNFLHTDYLAPIAVGQVIRTIGAAVAPPGLSNQIINRGSMAQDESRIGVSDRPADAGGRSLGDVTGSLPQWEGAGASDYTVYTRKDLTLRRGEKMIVTLFTRRIKYSHGYRWGVPGDIQHFLKLQNDTSSAWTTGPCLALSEGNALSEDLLKYVPIGGKGELPVTTAINVTHDQSETETDRKFKALETTRDNFLDLVTVAGKLELKNFGKKPIDLAVDLRVNGNPVTVADEGVVKVDTEKLRLQERTATVHWDVKIEAGQTKTLGYTYERYVPSN